MSPPDAGPAGAPRPKRPSAGATSSSKPVLRGAFEKAMESPASPPPAPPAADAGSGSAPAPQQLHEEWYVSRDGEQFGPFELEEAKVWVAGRDPSEELFCWTEGFDDWLATHKVAHFRRPRRESVPPPPPPRPSGSMGVAAATAESAEPKPLFAAALAAIERDEASGSHNLPSATNGAERAGSGHDPDFDFDIGEASRVVKLPMLAAAMRGGESAAGAGLPGMDEGRDAGGIGRGTGGYAQIHELGSDGQANPTRGPVIVPLSDTALAGKSPDLLQAAISPGGVKPWHLLAVLGGIAGVAVAVILLVVGGDANSAGDRSTRSRVTGEGLGYQLDPRQRKAAEQAEAAKQPRTVGRSRQTRATSGGRATTPTATRAGTAASTDPFAKLDDTTFGSDVGGSPLTPDDVGKVYQDNKLAVKLCYESALKKDPLLDVKKVYVNLTVAPTGLVSAVSMSDYADTPLGQCLVSRIRRWRFRKSSESFTGRFPLVFRN